MQLVFKWCRIFQPGGIKRIRKRVLTGHEMMNIIKEGNDENECNYMNNKIMRGRRGWGGGWGSIGMQMAMSIGLGVVQDGVPNRGKFKAIVQVH